MLQERKPLPPALPESVSDLVQLRKSEAKRTLNDQVEEIHLALYDKHDKYTEYLYAVYDEQAVEGSLAADNFKAAEIIRDEARKRDNVEVARQKLATLVKCLNVVQRRYTGCSRKERRNMIGGQVLSEPTNHNE
jgi:hypothetical protein